MNYVLKDSELVIQDKNVSVNLRLRYLDEQCNMGHTSDLQPRCREYCAQDLDLPRPLDMLR